MIFYLIIVPVVDRRRLKSSTLIKDLSISSFSSVHFCFIYFEFLYFGANRMMHLCPKLDHVSFLLQKPHYDSLFHSEL